MIRFTKTLEVDHLTFPEKAYDIIYIGIVGQTKNVIVGYAGLLLCGQILCQVGDDVALDSHGGGAPGETGGGGRVDAGGMIHKIGVKSALFYLLFAEIPGELMDDGPDHLQVPQFLCTCRGAVLRRRV